MGVDTLFVLAYDPIYGACYPTGGQTLADPALQDFLPRIVEGGLQVVASVNMNRYDHLVAQHPEMRVRTARGLYEPPLASAYANGYRTWFLRMLEDLVARVAPLSGLEAFEGTVALRLENGRDDMPDHHRDATRLFLAKWPKEPIGGVKWRDFRSLGMTLLHRTLIDVARRLPGATTYAAHSMPVTAPCDPNLLLPLEYGRLSGFDLHAVQSSGTDVFTLRTAWQRQEDACRLGVFEPGWTLFATSQIASRLDRSFPTQVAVEVDAVGLSADLLTKTLRLAMQSPAGTIVSDYSVLKAEGTIQAVRSAYLDA